MLNSMVLTQRIPVELNNNRKEDRKRHRFLGYLKAELSLLEGLVATVNTSYEFNSVKSGLYKPTYARMEGQSEHGWGQRIYDDYTNKQLELYLTYDKKVRRHPPFESYGWLFLPR